MNGYYRCYLCHRSVTQYVQLTKSRVKRCGCPWEACWFAWNLLMLVPILKKVSGEPVYKTSKLGMVHFRADPAAFAMMIWATVRPRPGACDLPPRRFPPTRTHSIYLLFTYPRLPVWRKGDKEFGMGKPGIPQTSLPLFHQVLSHGMGR